MATQIQLRRDTAANWTSTNPTLAQGEPGLETDTGKLKHGDGTTAWNSLAYQAAANIVDGTIVNADVNASAAIAGTKISPNFGSQNVVTTGTSTAASLIPTGSSVPTNGLYLPAANSVAISTNGTERLFVDASGRVIVNGSSTADVNDGAGSSFTPLLYSTTTSGSAGVGVYVNDGTNGRRAALFMDQTNGIWGLSSKWSTGQPEFVIRSGVNERLRIDSSGRLGLGTSAPATLMHLSSATGSASPTPTELRIATTTNASNWSITDPWGRISFYSADTSGSGPKIHAAINVTAFSVSANSSDINFLTNSNTTDTLTNRLTIKGDTGRVGIGTTSPGVALHVDGDIRCDGVYGETDTTTSIQFPGSDVITFNEGGSEAARIDSSGRLLVGTSSGYVTSTSATTQPLLQIHSTSTHEAQVSINSWATGTATGANLSLCRSDSGTVGTHTAVGSADLLGTIRFSGSDGDQFIEGASIAASADGTWGDNDGPTKLVFSVTADGASSPTEAMRIKNTRIINIANTPVYADNAAAKTGGLVDGDVYRTSTGDLKIVYT